MTTPPTSTCQQAAPVFLQYEEQLKGFIRKRIADEDDSKDLLQQVLLKLYRHCEKLPEVQNMQAWLYQITRNTLNDYFKEAARRRGTLGEAQEAMEVPEQSLHKEVTEYIRPMIALLPLKYAKPLIMLNYERSGRNSTTGGGRSVGTKPFRCKIADTAGPGKAA